MTIPTAKCRICILFGALAGITLVGAFLRLYRVGAQILEVDEAFSWRLTTYGYAELSRRTAEDVHPPLYYAALKAWVAAFGDRQGALRSMSALLGVISIPVIYLLCLQAGRHVTSDFWRPHVGALLGASLVAVHYTQVIAARTARMYSMGALLAGLSSWLLLNALHKERSRAWWSGYALTVAAFLYTHNYAMFTVFAQAVYALGFLAVKARRCSLQWALWRALQLVTAGLIVLLLYGPWVPTLLGQARGVKQSYWIEEPSIDQTLRSLSEWTTGSPCYGETEIVGTLCMLGILLCYGAWRTGFAGRFFVVQAVLPWVLSLGVSTYGGRSIFQERYLTFAQVSLFGAAAVVYASLRDRLERATLALAVVIVVAFNLWAWPTSLLPTSGAPDEFIAFFEEHYAPTDQVLLPGPAALNVFRYYGPSQ